VGHHQVAYYIVLPSDKLLCFRLHVYVSIHIIIYIVLALKTDAYTACMMFKWKGCYEIRNGIFT